MSLGLIIFLLTLAAYIGALIYLNAKTGPNNNGDSGLPENQAALKNLVNGIGLGSYGLLLLAFLIFAIGVIFFRDEFLPR
ncbi:MAG: hypothetical protein JST85_02300 [Acidobacteria bacterium]|nr:hypothetical protein [Acidobacteriota bacterium]